MLEMSENHDLIPKCIRKSLSSLIVDDARSQISERELRKWFQEQFRPWKSNRNMEMREGLKKLYRTVGMDSSSSRSSSSTHQTIQDDKQFSVEVEGLSYDLIVRK
jgi:hypothetical protein